MPIAVAFAKKAEVIGFDVNTDKINLYKQGIDPTREVGDAAIKAAGWILPAMKTDCAKQISYRGGSHPLKADKTPDLFR